MAIFRILLIFFLLFLFENAEAQRRFKAGPVIGLNASQIQNDDVGGYNKLGLMGGLRAIAVLGDRSDLAFEILYSQRGSYQKDSQFGGTLKIGLQYIEVPILWSYADWLDEEGGHFKLKASGGLTYGRLLKATAEGSKFDDVVDKFNTNDLGVTLGVEYYTSEHFSIGVRWTTSVVKLYNAPKNNTEGRNSLVGYFLSFRGAYVF